EIDLADILSLIPGVYQEYLDGVSASADISFSGSVKGTYNDQSMPAIAGEFGIENGAIKYLEYPVPIEKLSLGTSFDYPSADLKETSFSIDHFSMLVDGEEVNASLFFKDLEDYYWDFKMEGNLDLEKLTKIIPLEGMELEGKIAAGLQTSGRMSDLEAERYDKLPTQGDLSIEGFEYQSVDLPQGFGITSASASLNPSVISLSQFSGHAGRTDLNLSGDIKNYLQFALGKDEPLQGNFAFKSSIVDLNEWMAEEDTTAVVAEEADTAALEVVRIPANVDFVLASSIDKIIYDNLTLNEFAGKVIIKDGALRMQRVNFDLLDGYFEMNGAYETLPEEPTYDFDFKIKDLSIPQAFQSFTSIKQMVPVAERMNGKFSTDFQIGGSLLEDMMPNYDNMKGSGLVEVAQASLADVKLLSAVSSLTSLDNQDGKVTLKDVIMQTEVRDGRVFVKPFDVTLAGYTTTISGSNGIAGDLDYIFTMREVSTGLVGQAVSSLISSIGGSKKTDTKIDINLGVTGNYDEPKVKLLSSSTSKGAAGSATKAVVKSQKEAVTKRISEEKKVVQDSVKSVVTEKKKEVEKQANKEVEKAKEKAKSALKGLIKRRKN
ncbi:MAG: hypothetical protein KI790_19735, partial [Cyclobacteriaceae bacterium]|nr:hypothetical protein [Cyclobacteriaceae bacterium HetDA_MAG_MS6]